MFTDIASSIGPLRHAQANVARWRKPEKRKVGPFPLNLLGAKARVEYQPLGVVGVISPWNFPGEPHLSRRLRVFWLRVTAA